MRQIRGTLWIIVFCDFLCGVLLQIHLSYCSDAQESILIIAYAVLYTTG